MKVLIFSILLLVPALTAADTPIANGAKPAGDSYTMTFTRELLVDSDFADDDHYVWSGNHVAVQVNSKGHMFVVDPMENRIIELNPEGQFVRQIGKKGEGPGEFQLLSSFTLLADGSGVVYDNNQARNAFHYFDADLNFERREVLQLQGRFLQAAKYAPNGRYFSACFLDFNPETRSMKAKTGLLGPDKKVLLEQSARDQMLFDQSQAANSEWWVTFLASWFRVAALGRGVVAFGHDGTVYTANSNGYAINRLDADLKKTGSFSRIYKPIPWRKGELDTFAEPVREEVLGALPDAVSGMISENLIQKALTAAEFPAAKPPILGMIPFPEGLLVIHDYKPESGEVTADIFNKEGRYLGVTRLPDIEVNLFGGFFGSPMKMVFAGDKAYTIEQNDSDEPVLVRYAYKLEKR